MLAWYGSQSETAVYRMWNSPHAAPWSAHFNDRDPDNIGDPSSAIKLCNCFKVTIGLMVKSLSGFPPLRATELGRTPVSL